MSDKEKERDRRGGLRMGKEQQYGGPPRPREVREGAGWKVASVGSPNRSSNLLDSCYDMS